jgi:hypothetical protein
MQSDLRHPSLGFKTATARPHCHIGKSSPIRSLFQGLIGPQGSRPPRLAILSANTLHPESRQAPHMENPLRIRRRLHPHASESLRLPKLDLHLCWISTKQHQACPCVVRSKMNQLWPPRIRGKSCRFQSEMQRRPRRMFQSFDGRSLNSGSRLTSASRVESLNFQRWTIRLLSRRLSWLLAGISKGWQAGV